MSPYPRPGGRFHPNRYYGSDEAYLYTLATVLDAEYKAIADAGFILQLDCPDLRFRLAQPISPPDLAEFRRASRGTSKC